MKIVHYHSTTTKKNYNAHWKKRKAIDATYKKLKDNDFFFFVKKKKNWHIYYKMAQLILCRL